jgi:hypothetical protein
MDEQLPLFNNPDCDRTRAKHPMPAPDSAGLFDFPGVLDIAYRRNCVVSGGSPVSLNAVGQKVTRIESITYNRKERSGVVRKDTAGVTLTAIAPGLWDPVSIIAACSRARGLPVYEVDLATAKPKNEGGLDEIKIARICAADSLRPYLSRPSKYMRDIERENVVLPPLNGEILQYMREGWIADPPGRMVQAGAGEPTWAFKQVLFSGALATTNKLCKSYHWRKAARTLQDVGLLDVTPGPHGGLVRAVCTWTQLAYLRPVTVKAGHLADDDEYGLACLAAGLPVG